MSVRLRLRRSDGRIYLDRWGLEWKPLGGIFLHRMEAEDPGLDLHDHPWSFVSLTLWGGYTEEREPTRTAQVTAAFAEAFPESCTRGVVERPRWMSLRLLRLDECHRITQLHTPTRWVWSLVLHGPYRRGWGFYLPERGYMFWRQYEDEVRSVRREIYAELSSDIDEQRRDRSLMARVFGPPRSR